MIFKIKIKWSEITVSTEKTNASLVKEAPGPQSVCAPGREGDTEAECEYELYFKDMKVISLVLKALGIQGSDKSSNEW